MSYRHVDHTADTGLVVEAESLEELFRLAAVGMFDVTYSVPSQLPPAGGATDVVATGDGYADLLVNWLAELLARSEIAEVVYHVIDVSEVSTTEVRGTVAGVANSCATLVGPPIKAVTYHGLTVESRNGDWHAEVIFDV